MFIVFAAWLLCKMSLMRRIWSSFCSSQCQYPSAQTGEINSLNLVRPLHSAFVSTPCLSTVAIWDRKDCAMVRSKVSVHKATFWEPWLAHTFNLVDEWTKTAYSSFWQRCLQDSCIEINDLVFERPYAKIKFRLKNHRFSLLSKTAKGWICG